MAAALLRRGLVGRGESTSVESAGFTRAGIPSPPEVVEVMRAIGLDLSGHRSRVVTPGLLEGTDLVIGMTRQHVVDVGARLPAAWSRCFTIAELIRRGEAVGPRHPGETIASWVARMPAGRTRAAVISLPLAEDVADPLGKSIRVYRRTRDQLGALTDRVVALLAPA